MATVKLTASTYSVTGTVVVNQNEDSLYEDTSNSSNPARITHTTSDTSSYYLYLKGFNFSSIPSDAEVSSFTIRVKGYESGLSTNTSYAPRLYNNTTTITGASAASSNFGANTSTITVPYTGTWGTLKNYGSDLGIRLVIRRSSRRTQGYLYIYGAEIEVTYTVPVYHDVVVTNNTSATVSPTGTTTLLEGEDFTVSTNTLSDITITDNGTDVTSQFEQAHGGTVSATPGASFTTGFSSSSGAFYQNSSTVSTGWLEYAIGHSAESPYSTSNTSNTYVKPEGSTGWINYHFDFSDIPTSATINSVSVKVYGGRENATVDSTHVARFQCYSGSTAKGTIQNFTSTNNGSVTVSDVGTWTASELHDAQLRFELGYYGGRMLGITWTVTYTVSGYVYTISVTADHAIVFNESSAQPELYVKRNGSWVKIATAYKKVNGSWVQVPLDQAFSSGTNYVTG